MRYLIVDDERSARSILSSLLRRLSLSIPEIDEAPSLKAAEQLINQQSYDMIFLDIEMPYGGGMDLYERVDLTDSIVVFTTAYSEYAIQAIKNQAFDYLLKPLSPRELDVTLKKAYQKLSTASEEDSVTFELTMSTKLRVATSEGVELIDQKGINYLVADRNYTWIHCSDRRILSSKTLKEYEGLLCDERFVRIHKSHIVNLTCIASYINGRGGQVVMSDGMALNVSREKKPLLLPLLS